MKKCWIICEYIELRFLATRRIIIGYLEDVEKSKIHDQGENTLLYFEQYGEGRPEGMITTADHLLRFECHFRKWGIEWFVPILKRLARGEKVTVDEIGDDYRQANGRFMEWRRYPLWVSDKNYVSKDLKFFTERSFGTAKFYILSNQENGDSKRIIAYIENCPSEPILYYEQRDGEAPTGGQGSAALFLMEKSGFQIWGVEWFEPLLVRLVNGEKVTSEELNSAHQSVFGRSIEIRKWPLFRDGSGDAHQLKSEA